MKNCLPNNEKNTIVNVIHFSFVENLQFLVCDYMMQNSHNCATVFFQFNIERKDWIILGENNNVTFKIIVRVSQFNVINNESH